MHVCSGALGGRLVMVHGKLERGHVWEVMGASVKHLVVLLAGAL